MFQAFDSSFLTLILVGSVFAGITPLMLRGDQSVALCRCNGSQCSFDSCLQVICIVWLMLLIFLLATAYRFSIKFKSVSWAQKHHGHWTNFWYLLQCGQVPGSGKGQHLHNGPTPAARGFYVLVVFFQTGTLFSNEKTGVCVGGGAYIRQKSLLSCKTPAKIEQWSHFRNMKIVLCSWIFEKHTIFLNNTAQSVPYNLCVACSPFERHLWLFCGLLSSQQPCLLWCSPQIQTERPFRGSGNHWVFFGVMGWLGCGRTSF